MRRNAILGGVSRVERKNSPARFPLQGRTPPVGHSRNRRGAVAEVGEAGGAAGQAGGQSGPPRPLRAAGGEAEAEAVQPHDPTAGRAEEAPAGGRHGGVTEGSEDR